MSIRFASVIASVALIAGCASVGPDFDMGEVDRLQPGVTTIEQAKEKLGKPGSITNTANGEVGLFWSRSQVVMGAGKWKSVAILFDKDGKMIRVVSRNESATN
jgi:hypothetical protein